MGAAEAWGPDAVLEAICWTCQASGRQRVTLAAGGATAGRLVGAYLVSTPEFLGGPMCTS